MIIFYLLSWLQKETHKLLKYHPIKILHPIAISIANSFMMLRPLKTHSICFCTLSFSITPHHILSHIITINNTKYLGKCLYY